LGGPILPGGVILPDYYHCPKGTAFLTRAFQGTLFGKLWLLT